MNPELRSLARRYAQALQEYVAGRGEAALQEACDLGRQALSDGVGVRYQDDCLTLAVTYTQSNIRDRDIEPEQRVMVNLALKYLGTYQTATDAFSGLGADVSTNTD